MSTRSLMNSPVFNTDQIRNTQMHFKITGHWIMLHGHEDDVDDEADDDRKVKERVHDDCVESLFEPPPTATTVPLEEEVSQDGATWKARLLLPRL